MTNYDQFWKESKEFWAARRGVQWPAWKSVTSADGTTKTVMTPEGHQGIREAAVQGRMADEASGRRFRKPRRRIENLKGKEQLRLGELEEDYGRSATEALETLTLPELKSICVKLLEGKTSGCSALGEELLKYTATAFAATGDDDDDNTSTGAAGPAACEEDPKSAGPTVSDANATAPATSQRPTYDYRDDPLYDYRYDPLQPLYHAAQDQDRTHRAMVEARKLQDRFRKNRG